MNFSKLLFWIGAVITVPLYIWQKLTNIDQESGFFLEKGGFVWVFYGVLAVSLIGIVVYAMWMMKDCSFSISNSKTLAVLGFGVGGTILLGGVRELINLISAITQPSELSFGGPTTILQESSSTWLAVGIFVISLLSGYVFLRLAYGYFREDITNRGSYTFVFPILWALVCCVQLFTAYPQIAGMPDRVLFLICLVSFTVFLVGQGRILSDVNMKRGVRFACGCGLSAALSGFVLVAGELACITKGNALPIYDLVLIAFISLYCFSFTLGTRPLWHSH